MHPPALMDNDALDTAAPVCNCHRRRGSLPGPGKHNTVHFSAPGHVGTNDSAPVAPHPTVPSDSERAQSLPRQAETSAGLQMPQDIPVQYIVDQLHRLGPFYWHKPETTDCTIQVPMDQRRLSRSPNFDSPGVFNSTVLQNNLDIRRGSAPVSSQTNPAPKSFTTLKLHQFYLTAQSSLLRALFSGSSVIGLVSPQAPSVPSTSNGHYAMGAQLGGVRRDSTPSLAKIPRLLPSSARHPTLYLPLPDPASFPHIVHYLYFGTPAFIEEALSLGRIRWEGVVRNVEYLGLFEEKDGSGIRRWLAEWRERQYRRASVATTGYQPAHVHHHAHAQYMHTGSAMDPILVEESSEGSTSEENTDSEMVDSDDMEEDEEEEEEEDAHRLTGGWDPMVLAIAGMKMADPFALDLNGYAARQHEAASAPMPTESVDPLQG